MSPPLYIPPVCPPCCLDKDSAPSSVSVVESSSDSCSILLLFSTIGSTSTQGMTASASGGWLNSGVGVGSGSVNSEVGEGSWFVINTSGWEGVSGDSTDGVPSREFWFPGDILPSVFDTEIRLNFIRVICSVVNSPSESLESLANESCFVSDLLAICFGCFSSSILFLDCVGEMPSNPFPSATGDGGLSYSLSFCVSLW
ncbi:hypothetical protein NP493_660g01056 [Ridgeia piscesae]|uniref:Uncharacterized protein n=1 Tax=Ridgeia piscesae TaxID=27915 RepID=A0AAD9KRV9_RIDPI|nr:hypothetical protein NP493_660g01056 [Ridgeia piscesae]